MNRSKGLLVVEREFGWLLNEVALNACSWKEATC
jgi:hypothetical protein